MRNLDEIESLLNTNGFTTVYPEDLLIEDQIRTIAQGERIYGIHGAALGFQLFRNPEYHGVVMECFPSGYSNNWSRAMCFQTGDTWIGCQGELSLQVMKNILGGAHPRSSEGESFAVSLSGVNTVLRIANRALENGKDSDPQALISEVEPIFVG